MKFNSLGRKISSIVLVLALVAIISSVIGHEDRGFEAHGASGYGYGYQDQSYGHGGYGGGGGGPGYGGKDGGYGSSGYNNNYANRGGYPSNRQYGYAQYNSGSGEYKPAVYPNPPNVQDSGEYQPPYMPGNSNSNNKYPAPYASQVPQPGPYSHPMISTTWAPVSTSASTAALTTTSTDAPTITTADPSPLPPLLLTLAPLQPLPHNRQR
uniref:Uncharacterized protein n=1 Tax=Ditylenchus dipsaci TaxID=166011 RepID=A0A915CR89_9BILA